MAQIVVALGSSLNDRTVEVQMAQEFLETLSSGTVTHSSLYETEPVGPSKNTFINAVSVINSDLEPIELLERFKNYEKSRGRDHSRAPWTDREIDLDIIAYNSLVLKSQRLTIPHPLYNCRDFVLIPMKEVLPNWRDPETQTHIDQMIANSDTLSVTKVNV